MLDITNFDKIIIANWKLNGSNKNIAKFLNDLKGIVPYKSSICTIICPPSIYLNNFFNNLDNIYLGGQNCSNFNEGAYTGEISANMLKENKCDFCIVGHSERRAIFKETNKDIRIQAENLINNNINPIICIGETLEQKNLKQTKNILIEQVNESIPKFSEQKTTILAYEPVWAIGTGLTPSLQEIDEIHLFLKKEIENYQDYKILYGGSVKSYNANEIMNLKNVDGVLVGGASLDSNEFKKIINS